MRPDKKHQPNARHGEQHNVVRRPFDSREVDRLPQATEQDLPYRPWWVVDAPSSEEADPQA